MTNEEIARRIKQARLERGFTQKDLAKFLNKTPSNISDIERCRVQVSAVDLHTLAEALNKPIEYFFGEQWGDREIEDLVGLMRTQTPETNQRAIEMMRVLLSMQTLAQDIQASGRETTVEEQQRFITDLVSFLVQFEHMKKQVDALRAELVDALKALGMDLPALLGNP
jgi:transcriptional regulator with XRE-family HTH domain